MRREPGHHLSLKSAPSCTGAARIEVHATCVNTETPLGELLAGLSACSNVQEQIGMLNSIVKMEKGEQEEGQCVAVALVDALFLSTLLNQKTASRGSSKLKHSLQHVLLRAIQHLAVDWVDLMQHTMDHITMQQPEEQLSIRLSHFNGLIDLCPSHNVQCAALDCIADILQHTASLMEKDIAFSSSQRIETYTKLLGSSISILKTCSPFVDASRPCVLSMEESCHRILQLDGAHKDCLTKAGFGLVTTILVQKRHPSSLLNQYDTASAFCHLAVTLPLINFADTIVFWCTSLHIRCYSIAKSHCFHPSGPERLYALQVLTQWTDRLVKSPEFIPAIIEGTNVLDDILHILHVNWEHKLQMIAKSLQPLYLAFLHLQAALSSTKAHTNFALQILSMEPSKRAKYDMLRPIIPLLQKEDQLIPFLNATSVIADLVCTVEDARVWGQANKVLLDLLIKSKQCIPLQQWRAIWLDVVLEKYQQCEPQERAQLQSHVLQPLIRKDPGCYTFLIDACSDNPHTFLPLLLCGKRNGHQDIVHRHMDNIRQFLIAFDDTTRLDALDILCASSKTTEAPSAIELDLFVSYFEHQLHTQETSTKDRMLHIVQRFFLRLRNSIVKKGKEKLSNSRVHDIQSKIYQLYQTVLDRLYPGSPVERIGVELEVLYTFHQVFDDDTWMQAQLMQSRLILVQCSLTSWDRVRSLCGLLLSHPCMQWSRRPEETRQLSDWAIDLMKQARLRDAETGALLYSILVVDALQEGKALVRESIIQPSNNPGIESLKTLIWLLEESVIGFQRMECGSHGFLIALRHTFQHQQWIDSAGTGLKEVAALLLRTIARVQDASMQYQYQQDGSIDCRGHYVLSKDSELKEDIVSSNSWLAIKESALTAAALLRFHVNHQPCLSTSMIQTMGDDLIRILLRSKHNGVIQKAHLGLTSMFSALFESQEPVYLELLASWHTSFLQLVSGDLKARENSWIRRSAGLPYCFLALFHAEPETGTHSFLTLTLKHLLTLASSTEQWEVQVHTLNVLRSILRDSALSIHVLPFLADAFDVVLRGFQSHDWSVRNSALMTFSSVIQLSIRPGKQGTRLGAFFKQYPALFQSIVVILGSCTQVQDSNQLYPVFVLLSRLQGDLVTSTHAQQLASLVDAYGSSSSNYSFLIRQMAARAYASLVQPTVETISQLLSVAVAEVSANGVHFRLLQCVSVLERGIEDASNAWDIVGERLLLLQRLENPLLLACACRIVSFLRLLDASAFAPVGKKIAAKGLVVSKEAPGAVACHKASASLLFYCNIHAALNDPRPHVIEAALASTAVSVKEAAGLQQLLLSTQSPSLQIAVACSLSPISNLEWEQSDVEALLRLVQTTRSHELKGHILALVGPCMDKAPTQAWFDRLFEAVNPALENTRLRQQAFHALKRSATVPLPSRVWRLVLHGMTDEDEAVRECCIAIAGKEVPSIPSASCLADLAFTMSLHHLGATRWSDHGLMEWVLSTFLVSFGSHNEQTHDEVLFEQEKSNDFIDPVYRIRGAAGCLLHCIRETVNKGTQEQRRGMGTLIQYSIVRILPGFTALGSRSDTPWSQSLSKAAGPWYLYLSVASACCNLANEAMPLIDGDETSNLEEFQATIDAYKDASIWTVPQTSLD